MANNPLKKPLSPNSLCDTLTSHGT